MSDITQQIGQLLSDPGTMEQIKALSSMLGQNTTSTGDSAPPPEPPKATAHNTDISADMLPAVMSFMPLISSLREEDDTTRLLRAIKPFLSEARQEKLEQAIKILRIIRLVPLLKNNGLLNLM